MCGGRVGGALWGGGEVRGGRALQEGVKAVAPHVQGGRSAVGRGGGVTPCRRGPAEPPPSPGRGRASGTWQGSGGGGVSAGCSSVVAAAAAHAKQPCPHRWRPHVVVAHLRGPRPSTWRGQGEGGLPSPCN